MSSTGKLATNHDKSRKSLQIIGAHDMLLCESLQQLIIGAYHFVLGRYKKIVIRMDDDVSIEWPIDRTKYAFASMHNH